VHARTRDDGSGKPAKLNKKANHLVRLALAV
jgi:hypothetical protein